MRKTARARAAACAVVLLLGLAGTPGVAQGFSNGQLPASALAPVHTGAACNQLANPAAAGYNTMALYAGKALPVNGCMSAYRTYAQQVYLWNHCPAICARPGTSNHGWGRAVDVPPWVRSYIDAHGAKFGYSKACSDAPSESWHVLFCVPFSRPDPGLSLTSPILRVGSGGSGQHHFVKRVQQLLREHGARGLDLDGQFGPTTRRAVSRFQEAEKIHADGVVGPTTWRHLREPVKPVPAPPTPTPPSGLLRGIDVSQHQPDIDWSKVRADGYRFAIAKASEGGDYHDPSFGPGRYKAIAGAGLRRGTYHFLRPKPGRAGAVEATFYVQSIRDAGYRYGDVRPVADLETTELSPAGTCAYLHSFVHRMRSVLDVGPILYTYPSFAQANLAGCGRWLGKLPLWIAHYGVSKPTVPRPWSGYAIWQRSSSGSVAGVAGSVDVNLAPHGIDRRLIYHPPKATVSALSAPKIEPTLGEPDHPHELVESGKVRSRPRGE